MPRLHLFTIEIISLILSAAFVVGIAVGASL